MDSTPNRLFIANARHASIAAFFLVAIGQLPARAGPSSEDLGSVFGGVDSIASATGYEHSLFDAPTTATVVTREEISRAGYVSLADVIAHTPGFHVTTNDGRTTKIIARGITSRVLVMIDGVPLTQGYLNGNLGLNNVLLHDVERIEFCLGPGSALYGADAVTGTINLISRTRSGAPIAEVGGNAATTDDGGIWGIYSHPFENGHVAFYGAFATDTYSEEVLEADAQTPIDRALGTNASLAPGRINSNRKIGEARFDASFHGFRARALHHQEYDYETGVGWAGALDPTGSFNVKQTAGEVSHDHDFDNGWSTHAQLIFSDVTQWADVAPYPAGAFRNTFPDGVRQSYELNEIRQRLDFSATFGGFERHRLHFLAGGLDAKYDTVKETRNYTVARGRVVPTGAFLENGGPSGVPVIQDTSRTVKYIAGQDEWQLARDVTFTAGVRIDDYSDVGTTTNPRASLVWSPTLRTSLKLMYGQAFRPPSITELESNGIYSPLGNRDLRPSTLRMSEAVVSHRREKFEGSIRVFRYNQHDLVSTVRTTASPSGSQYVNDASDEGWGGELVGKFALGKHWVMQGYYLRQQHTGEFRDSPLAQAPESQAELSLMWAPNDYWSAYASGIAVLDRGRAAGDPRSTPSDYYIVDMTVRRRGLFEGLDLSFAVTNAFDRSYKAASESATNLPLDIPMPSRRITFTLVKSF
jgi:outer membrane receptor for ferrienterochelin and colicin